MLWIFASAHAGGYFYSDSGIVATGRGGAFVAGARGQFAQAYNPAGLIHQDAPTVNVGWSLVQQEVQFRRLDAEGSFYDEVQNGAAPFNVPELGFATPIVRDRLAFAFGFYSPFAPSSDYPEEGAQRYTIKQTSVYQFSIGPSAALRVHDTLVLGLGLQWQYLQLAQSVDITVTGIDDPAGDVAVSAKAADRFTPNVNLGLLFEPVEPLTVGLALQPPTTFRARGEGELDFVGSAFAGLLGTDTYVDDDIAVNIDLPWVVRAGVAVRPVPKLEIEGAVVWQGWSSLEDIRIEDVDVTLDTELLPEDQRQVADTFELPAGLSDTISLRLGAEADVHERVALRVGGFWESGSVQTQELTVALVDPWKVQLGGGGSVWVAPERLKLDFAFAGLFFPSLSIRDSTATQIDAGLLDTITPRVVGNGDLSSRGWVLGAAASVAFPRGGARE